MLLDWRILQSLHIKTSPNEEHMLDIVVVLAPLKDELFQPYLLAPVLHQHPFIYPSRGNCFIYMMYSSNELTWTTRLFTLSNNKR